MNFVRRDANWKVVFVFFLIWTPAADRLPHKELVEKANIAILRHMASVTCFANNTLPAPKDMKEEFGQIV